MDPIETKYRRHMNETMKALEKLFPDMGVALFVFPLGEPGKVNYIANADRAGMIEALEEFIRRNKAG